MVSEELKMILQINSNIYSEVSISDPVLRSVALFFVVVNNSIHSPPKKQTNIKVKPFLFLTEVIILQANQMFF